MTVSRKAPTPSGTRTYRYPNGDVQRYTPVAPADRKQAGPRARGERGAYVGNRWYPEIVVVPLDERAMPDTVPDDEAFDHRYGCRCVACRRPQALWYKQQKRLTPARAPRAPRQPRQG